MTVVMLVVGLLLLWAGGEGLVRGASSLGRRLGLSPVVIGLTIVSVGTSSPELAAAVTGVLRGVPAMSFGNIVGSNIANLGLVLGVTAMIWPLHVASRFLQKEVPCMLVASGLTFALVWNGQVNRVEGFSLLGLLALYLWTLLKPSNEPAEVSAQFDDEFGGKGKSVYASLLFILAGIAGLILGAQALVQGAGDIARSLGISERVIGLTVVALGTSLPEMASSVVAAQRRQGDIVLGNLVGSNVFNILFILGTTALVQPVAVETGEVWTDLVVMLGVSLLVWFFLATGTRLSRFEGLLLTLLYVGYIGYLFF